MKDGKIRIAVWNIYGPTHGTKSPASAEKIRSFQEEVKPDIAFYLEAPDKNTEPIPDPEKGINKNWDTAIWCPSEGGNPRGILAVKYKKNDAESNEMLSIEEIDVTEGDKEDKKGRTALGIKIRFDDKKIKSDDNEILRILAVWTTPDTSSKSQSAYFNTLSDILDKYKPPRSEFFDDKDVLRVVAGDTNVNLSARAQSEKQNNQTDNCKTFHEKITALAGQCKSGPRKSGLQLCDKTGLQENTLHKGDLYYRCDLLMSSDDEKILSPSLGKFGYADDFKSDHRPIIFEVPVPSR